jgi:hypothetical protein
LRVGGAAAFAGVAVALTLGWTGGPLSDPDVWWHVRTGRWILDHHAIPHTDPWSFTAPHGSWVPTAWLSDVLFGLASRVGGDEGLRVLRVVLAAAAVVAVWVVARRSATTSRDAFLATGLGVLALAPFLRERPQVLSLLLVACLSLLLQRILAGEIPRLLPCVLLCWLWANLHGMWVLLPAGVLGAGVLAWWEDRSRVPLAARCTVVALLSWAAVLLTPVGPRLAWWPLVVRDAAAPITEWQPTVLLQLVGAPLLLLLLVLVVRWARATTPVPVVHVVFSLAVVVFGLLAFRNVAPAALLLLPEVARRWDAGVEREPLPLVPRAGAAAVAVGLVLACVYLVAGRTVSADQPVALVDRLAGRDAPVRLLNHYDVGGLVTGKASPPAHVAIDGRTDIWSPAYVRRYVDALNGAPDWRALVDDLRPDAALLPEDSEVARGLVLERHWHVVDSEGRWQLLEPAS